MKSKIKIDVNSQIPIYKQLIQEVQNLVDLGIYRDGDFIPSMNDLAEELDISKETVMKAYSGLKDKGIIGSLYRKGFYITNEVNRKIRILVLFDKISNYKQVLYSTFSDAMGENAVITIRLHNQDADAFEHFINEYLDNFDYYLITPHFPLKPDIQKRVLENLKKIPPHKLILLDRYIDSLPGDFGSVYQDFEQDAYDGLAQGVETLKKYEKLNVISMPGSMYASMMEKGISRFCLENNIRFEMHKNISATTIKKHEVFLIINSQHDYELIELARNAKAEGLLIGKDIGIISYNESPVNEIILGGLSVLSTDFKQMGNLAACMINDKSLKKVRCDFRLIQRSTF